MNSQIINGKRASVIVICLAAAAILAACGGSSGSSGSSSSSGSGGGGGGGGGGNTPGATQNTRGLQSTPTPNPTPTPTISIIVRNGRILDTIHLAGPGAQIIVPPGLYAPFTITASDLQGPIVLIADVTGALTNSGAAPVTINANGGTTALTLSGIPTDSAVILDGFTFSGGTTAGLVVDGSPSTLVEDCTFTNNAGDGVQFTGSANSFLFNDLVYGNKGAGVRALSTDALAIFNNTVYGNKKSGISLGDTATNGDAENNIVSGNTPYGIVVTAAADATYFGDYNLTTDPNGPDTTPGAHDLTAGPQFIFPSTGSGADFHLAPSSPALGAGDPTLAQTSPDIVSFLQQLSVLEDGTPDCQLVSLGFHYPTDQSCNPATPTPVVATTKKKKPTPTPTP